MRKSTRFTVDLGSLETPQTDKQGTERRPRIMARIRPNKGEYIEPHTESVEWKGTGPRLTASAERQLMLRLEELARLEGLREDRSRTKISSTTQSLIDSKASDSEVLKKDGDTILEGPFVFKELSCDPDDPNEGHAVIWMSDGTDSGDDGDILVKVTAGGATKTVTLVDFSET